MRVLKRLLLLTESAAVMGFFALLWACGGDPPPTCNGCNPTTNPGPFDPGMLPGTADNLDGPRCATTGSNLGVFNNVLLAVRTADLTTNVASFAANDPFLIYWTICNVGAGSSDAVGTPQGLQVSGPGFGQTFSYTIPALDSCDCITPQQQFTSGLVNTGAYTATLVGQFTTQLNFTVTP